MNKREFYGILCEKFGKDLWEDGTINTHLTVTFEDIREAARRAITAKEISTEWISCNCPGTCATERTFGGEPAVTTPEMHFLRYPGQEKATRLQHDGEFLKLTIEWDRVLQTANLLKILGDETYIRELFEGFDENGEKVFVLGVPDANHSLESRRRWARNHRANVARGMVNHPRVDRKNTAPAPRGVVIRRDGHVLITGENAIS